METHEIYFPEPINNVVDASDRFGHKPPAANPQGVLINAQQRFVNLYIATLTQPLPGDFGELVVNSHTPSQPDLRVVDDRYTEARRIFTPRGALGKAFRQRG